MIDIIPFFMLPVAFVLMFLGVQVAFSMMITAVLFGLHIFGDRVIFQFIEKIEDISSNFVFASRGADYLQSTLPPSPLQHYWSLAVEEQFYFVWPAVLALLCVGAASRIAIRRRVGILAITVSVVSFAMCMILMNTSQPWAFFAPHTRAFELSIGALFAVLPVATSKSAKIFNGISAWVGLVVVCCCVVLFHFSEECIEFNDNLMLL